MDKAQDPVASPGSLVCYFKEPNNNAKLVMKIKRPMTEQKQPKESDNEVTILEEKSTKAPKSEERKKKSSRKKKAGPTSNKSVKGKKITKKADSEPKDGLRQSQITSHFQIRRSNRRCKSALKVEKDKIIMEKLLDEDESGLEVRVLPHKGRGIFALKGFKRGELICEYAGELINYSLGKQRELEYSHEPELGCYSYFFQYKNKKYCVDATKESSRLGRLLNHSKTENNVCTRVFPIKDVPRLILVADRDIEIGEELLYDYGERSKSAIESHPWLQK